MNQQLAFRNRPWNQRLLGMGDIAEQRFEQEHEVFSRTGFNRPPFDTRMVPPIIMYMPDYFDGTQWWEVQGCGRDGIIKLKTEKAEALFKWQNFSCCPVQFFFYNSDTDMTAEISLGDLTERTVGYSIETFPEGKTYWAIPFDTLVV